MLLACDTPMLLACDTPMLLTERGSCPCSFVAPTLSRAGLDQRA